MSNHCRVRVLVRVRRWVTPVYLTWCWVWRVLLMPLWVMSYASFRFCCVVDPVWLDELACRSGYSPAFWCDLQAVAAGAGSGANGGSFTDCRGVLLNSRSHKRHI